MKVAHMVWAWGLALSFKVRRVISKSFHLLLMTGAIDQKSTLKVLGTTRPGVLANFVLAGTIQTPLLIGCPACVVAMW